MHEGIWFEGIRGWRTDDVACENQCAKLDSRRKFQVADKELTTGVSFDNVEDTDDNFSFKGKWVASEQARSDLGEGVSGRSF